MINHNLYPSQWAALWDMLVTVCDADPIERSSFVTLMEFGGIDYHFKALGLQWIVYAPKGGEVSLRLEAQGLSEGQQRSIEEIRALL